MNVERFESEFIVSGDEDDVGAVGGREVLEDIEAVEFRHLDIEEDKVGFEFIDESNGGLPVVGFAYNINFRRGGEEVAQAFASEFLVVDNDGANFGGHINDFEKE